MWECISRSVTFSPPSPTFKTFHTLFPSLITHSSPPDPISSSVRSECCSPIERDFLHIKGHWPSVERTKMNFSFSLSMCLAAVGQFVSGAFSDRPLSKLPFRPFWIPLSPLSLLYSIDPPCYYLSPIQKLFTWTPSRERESQGVRWLLNNSELCERAGVCRWAKLTFSQLLSARRWQPCVSSRFPLCVWDIRAGDWPALLC